MISSSAFSLAYYKLCIDKIPEVTKTKVSKPKKYSLRLLSRLLKRLIQSFISVSVTRLCSSLGLELMLKLSTLFTVFTFLLKDKALDYGKGRYISYSCLWSSANHNALGQLANQSRLCLSEGGALREAGHRGPTMMYSI